MSLRSVQFQTSWIERGTDCDPIYRSSDPKAQFVNFRRTETTILHRPSFVIFLTSGGPNQDEGLFHKFESKGQDVFSPENP